MAIYSFCLKHVSRSAGRSATAAAAYRGAERIHDERTGRTHDYTNKPGVLSNVILTPNRAPEWARNVDTLWNKVEQIEKRKDSRLARENIVALPHELTLEQNIEWLHQFVNDNYVKRGMAVQVSIHGPDKHGDQRNYHAHILMTTRQITRNGFKNKKPEKWNDKITLYQWREEFAKHQNRALERHGFSERVDHRSNKDRGIDREPTQHLGPAANQIERDDKTTDIGDKNRLTQELNRNLEAMKQQERKLQAEIKREQNRETERKKQEQSKAQEKDRPDPGPTPQTPENQPPPKQPEPSKPKQPAPEPPKQKELPSSLRPKPVSPNKLKRPESFRRRLDAERALRYEQDRKRDALARENEKFYKRKETEAKLRQTKIDLQKQNNLWGKITGKQKEFAEQARVLKLNLESKKQREKERVDALEKQLRDERLQKLGPDKPKQNVRRDFRKAVYNEPSKPAPSKPRPKPLRARTAAQILKDQQAQRTPAKPTPPLVARKASEIAKSPPPQKAAPAIPKPKSLRAEFNKQAPPKPTVEASKPKELPVLRSTRPTTAPKGEMPHLPGVRKEPISPEPKKDTLSPSERERCIKAFKERIKQRREHTRGERNRDQDRGR